MKTAHDPDHQALSRSSADGSDFHEQPPRFIGIDAGAETIKLIELAADAGQRVWTRQRIIEHGKHPGPALLRLLEDWDWASVSGAAVTGRLSRMFNLPQIPTKQAQARGYSFLFGDQPATIVSVGSRGFSVLALRPNGVQVFRENSRCSQGTGNFLRQLVERFSLGIEEASELCADVERAAPLSGRCPVILKTDMTHLANKGENRAQILAGLFDAVSENVISLIKPGLNPSRVFLIGGLSRSRRVRTTFARILSGQGMELMPLADDDALYFEALGSALMSSESASAQEWNGSAAPPLEDLLAARRQTHFQQLAPLAGALPKVRRLRQNSVPENGHSRELVLGFDIGSTGSKLVALDAASGEGIWEAYGRTAGDPVGAAQALVRQFVQRAGHDRVRAAAVTGSGREIAGSLLSTCYGADAVFVLNEIAAHAQGALHYDPRVDTIFEIGGQDAKYIRLLNGQVIDCAMNEACSAGTGSFIEEQGKKFSGIRDVSQLGTVALSAPSGVSLGQHCSVFMAEVIDESVAAGVDTRAIIAGLYDSIIQNYLHRVKGNRSVGQVIFCQGMPFAADALAAAVARQTGSEVVVPPNPGTVGALGIALLARREVAWEKNDPLDLDRFLEARIEQKETFVCKATTGCGGSGNRCRIDSIRTNIAGQRQRFNWGGACSLYDKGTNKRKLPNLAPDPFREREELARATISPWLERRGGRTVALTDEFTLKGLLPFFAAFLSKLGFDIVLPQAADHAALKRGVQGANIPFCAPMQLYHGVVSQMAAEDCDYLFLPMLRSTPRAGNERDAVTCPIVQASPHILRLDLGAKTGAKIVSPVFDIGTSNYHSNEFLSSCERLAAALNTTSDWRKAASEAAKIQLGFEQGCRELGERALEFCAEHKLLAVVVVGRPYTIYNKVLNSNVPALIREQGAMAVPLDCFPVEPGAPVFDAIFWGYSQRILRAGWQARRTPGVYCIYCSNYSCGPDSFNLHFFAHLMAGKPFAIIETDGHSGDAGTKTRVEAFLYCAAEDVRNQSPPPARSGAELDVGGISLREVLPDERVLVPYMGPSSDVVASCIRGLGHNVEGLPMPSQEALRIGRRHTSGKECVPMCLTLGSLLERLEAGRATDEKYVLLMPGARGPCRFGVYNLLNRITLDQLGWRERVRICSPPDSNYFRDLPAGYSMLMFAGLMASDLLLDALLDVRPAEKRPGTAVTIYGRYHRELIELIERESRGNLNLIRSLWRVAAGDLFGMTNLLERAALDFAAARGKANLPTVLMVGEIYVRLTPFANDFIIEQLERRGCRVKLAPMHEWIEYTTWQARAKGKKRSFGAWLSQRIQTRIQTATQAVLQRVLGLHPTPRVAQMLQAARPYIPGDLSGEAVLTLGGPIHEWQQRRIDAVVSVGPHECMPNKIAETQFFHAAEREGLLSLTVPVHGDPIDGEVLDNFAFEVKARFSNGRHVCPGKAFSAGKRPQTVPAARPETGVCARCHLSGSCSTPA
jgi:predicted CoA-substrate-specific enzyme activase